MYLIFIGGIISLLGTMLIVFGTLEQHKKNSEKSTRIETGVQKANDDLATQHETLKATSAKQLDKIDELRQENAGLYAKLATSTNKIYDNLTGDGNKPTFFVTCTPLNEDPEFILPSYYMVQFYIKNFGKFPLRNMKVIITDFTGRELIKYGIRHSVIKFGSAMSSGVNDKDLEYRNFDFFPSFDIGALAPNDFRPLYRTAYNQEINVIPASYNIDITWDNGSLKYFVTFKIEDGILTLDHCEGLFNGATLDDMSYIKFKPE